MRAELDTTFATGFVVEVITELPTGDTNLFFYPGARTSGRDGLLLKIVPLGGRPWIAVVARGRHRLDRVVYMPDGRRFCAIAGGDGFLIDAEDYRNWMEVPLHPVADHLSVSESRVVVFAGLTELIAYDEEGPRWRTERIAWDGLEFISVEATKIRGRFWDLRSEDFQEFRVDLETGAQEGGVGEG